MKLRILRKRLGKETWGDSGVRQYYHNDELQYYDPTVQDEEIAGWKPVPIVEEK